MGIPVVNMGKMLFFYQDLLGFTIRSDEIEEGYFLSSILNIPNVRIHVVKMVTPNGWMLELLQYLSCEDVQVPRMRKISDVGIAHMALTVSNVDFVYDLMMKNNVSCLSSPCISPSGKAKVFFCQDPEFNYLELVEMI